MTTMTTIATEIANREAALAREQTELAAAWAAAAQLPPRERWLAEQEIDAARHDRARRWRSWQEEIEILRAQLA